MGRGFLFISLLIALPVAAQIYKYTDAAGNTAYSLSLIHISEPTRPY